MLCCEGKGVVVMGDMKGRVSDRKMRNVKGDLWEWWHTEGVVYGKTTTVVNRFI